MTRTLGTRGTARGVLALIVCAGALWLGPSGGPAAAASGAESSHYRLPAAGLVTEAESDALRRVGIATTADLFARARTPTSRSTLAAATRLSSSRVAELAGAADLLRLDGVGPSTVALLHSAGVAHTRALIRADVAALAARLATLTAPAVPVDARPGALQLSAWIDAARRLTPTFVAAP